MRVKMAQRILWLSVIALCLFGTLGYRVYDLQIAQNRKLTEEVYAQRTQSLPLQMRRGAILDRNGVPLTDPESGWAIGLFPKLLAEEDAATAERLAEVLDRAQVGLLLAHARQSPAPAWLLEVDRQRAEQVGALGLPGIVTGPSGRRYGADSLARHLVGYANEAGGQLGLERAYEADLAGERVPHLVASFDGRDRSLFGGVRQVEARTGKEPYDLFTTLDVRIQRVVEHQFDTTRVPGGTVLRGAVVVMDAETGDLLALASRPNYSQVDIFAREGHSPLTNRALVAYEPGSIFKSLVAAAALEEGKVTLDEEFECPGHYQMGSVRFSDANGTGHGTLSFREAIAQSCNITFIKVGYERLGAERLLATARLFGLGSSTGLLPDEESAGLLPRLEFGGDVAQFSFGQAGLMATPVQMARAYAAIANGGVLPPVRLVTAAKSPSGQVMARPETEAARRIISKETARDLQEALLGVTHPEGRGTGRNAWVEGAGSAGKTGSAETVRDGRPVTHAWFAGWVPVGTTRYVIVVLVEDGKSGGLVAAPLFRQIARGILGL